MFQIRFLFLFLTLLLSTGQGRTVYAQAQFEEQQNAAQNEDRKWYEPAHVKVQFAGGIGFISPGFGFSYAKNKMETDLFFGYLPKQIGGEHIVMLTLKNTFIPFTIKPENSRLTIHPLTIGGFFNYTFGNQYETFWPDHYPTGYYWWDSAIRLGFFLGGNVRIPVKNNVFDAVSAYYELGSNDLYLISYIQNINYFKPYDILNLAIGVKMAF